MEAENQELYAKLQNLRSKYDRLLLSFRSLQKARNVSNSSEEGFGTVTLHPGQALLRGTENKKILVDTDSLKESKRNFSEIDSLEYGACERLPKRRKIFFGSLSSTIFPDFFSENPVWLVPNVEGACERLHKFPSPLDAKTCEKLKEFGSLLQPSVSQPELPIFGEKLKDTVERKNSTSSFGTRLKSTVAHERK